MTPQKYLFLTFCLLTSGIVLNTMYADAKTYCRLVPERMDDFAWENDKIAFRAYGPALKDKPEASGFDAWLKRVDYPIIDKWYRLHLEENKSYHTDHGEGYDPYKVGGSLGCGGLALWLEGKLVSSNVFTSWKILKQEDDESVFILNYEWTHQGDQYNEEKKITIQTGQRLFHSQSTFTKNGKTAVGLPVAIGLVRHNKNDTVQKNLEAGWIAIWEVIDGSGLGTGVKIDPNHIESFQLLETGNPLEDHALIVSQTDASGQISYHTGYGWERADEIKSLEDWVKYLNAFQR